MGVYTAFRTFGGHRVFDFVSHLNRTERSMALLGMDRGLDRSAICLAVHDVTANAAAAVIDSRVRIDILSTSIETSGGPSRVVVGVSPLLPLPTGFLFEGVAVGVAPG